MRSDDKSKRNWKLSDDKRKKTLLIWFDCCPFLCFFFFSVDIFHRICYHCVACCFTNLFLWICNFWIRNKRKDIECGGESSSNIKTHQYQHEHQHKIQSKDALMSIKVKIERKYTRILNNPQIENRLTTKHKVKSNDFNGFYHLRLTSFNPIICIHRRLFSAAFAFSFALSLTLHSRSFSS